MTSSIENKDLQLISQRLRGREYELFHDVVSIDELEVLGSIPKITAESFLYRANAVEVIKVIAKELKQINDISDEPQNFKCTMIFFGTLWSVNIRVSSEENIKIFNRKNEWEYPEQFNNCPSKTVPLTHKILCKKNPIPTLGIKDIPIRFHDKQPDQRRVYYFLYIQPRWPKS